MGTYPFLVNTKNLPRLNHPNIHGIVKPRPPVKSSPRHSPPTALASPGRTDGSSTATPVASHVGEVARGIPPRFLIQVHSNSPVIHPLSWQSAGTASASPSDPPADATGRTFPKVAKSGSASGVAVGGPAGVFPGGLPPVIGDGAIFHLWVLAAPAQLGICQTSR